MPKKGGKKVAPEAMDDLFVVDKVGSKAEKKGGKRKKRTESGPTEEELEELLFGEVGGGALGKEGEGSDGDDDGAEAAKPGTGHDSSDEEEGSDGGEKDEEDEEDEEEGEAEAAGKEEAAAASKAAWHDDDDDEVEVDIAGVDRLRKLRQDESETVVKGAEFASRLKQQFGKTHGGVSWATRKRAKTDEDDPADELLRSTKGFLARRGGALPQSVLDVVRMADANVADTSDCVIQSVRFHPTSMLMLTAGLDKRLKLFQVDGKKNSKVQSVFFEDLPISTADFSADGGEVFLSGRRKHWYTFDLGAARITKIEGVMGRGEKSLESMYVSPDNGHIVFLGNCGRVSVLSRKTKQWVADLHMNHDARAACFSPDGRQLYTGGGGGVVYVWDMRMRRVLKKIVDEGSVGVSALAMAPRGGILAVGSTSGVVNTYDTATFERAAVGVGGEVRPESRKGIMNLTTRIDELRFQPESEVLAMSSHTKKQGLRMVHTASSTVFSNWPTAGTPLKYVNSVDFSSKGGFMAVGNDKGKVLLYRLKHYS